MKTNCCPIIELRQYTLHPGTRDTLIDLFDREFVETQEAVGIQVIGQFRDIDDPDRFVWLRGFPDMLARAESLHAFYGGPVWEAHRAAANATMIDSDNVLLLRPAYPESGFFLDHTPRLPIGAIEPKEYARGQIIAAVLYLDAPADRGFIELFEHTLEQELIGGGASTLAYFVTESSTNTFAKLPVREGEHVFVWFAHSRNRSAPENRHSALVKIRHWQEEVS